MLPRIVRSPVEICLGTSPSQAPKSRPFENAAPLPIAATVALDMIGPMPGTVIHKALAASANSRLAGEPLAGAFADPPPSQGLPIVSQALHGTIDAAMSDDGS